MIRDGLCCSFRVAKGASMGRLEDKKGATAMLAFGRSVYPDATFNDLVTAHGWQTEAWAPTFIEECEREGLASERPEGAGARPAWEQKHVLRLPVEAAEPRPSELPAPDPRIMIASAPQLPTLYYVEWHYIDFVLSCLGSVSEAARVLGVRRSTLQRKRKKTPPNR
jgi:hypothetical protein